MHREGPTNRIHAEFAYRQRHKVWRYASSVDWVTGIDVNVEDEIEASTRSEQSKITDGHAFSLIIDRKACVGFGNPEGISMTTTHKELSISDMSSKIGH